MEKANIARVLAWVIAPLSSSAVTFAFGLRYPGPGGPPGPGGAPGPGGPAT